MEKILRRLERLTPWRSRLIKFVVSVILLWFVFSKIHWAEFIEVIGRVKIQYVVLAAALLIPSQLISSFRWYYILRIFNKDTGYSGILMKWVRAVFASLILPGQVSGDIVRIVSLEKSKYSYSISLLSVLIEKVIAFIGLLLFIAIGMSLSWDKQLLEFQPAILLSLMILLIALNFLSFFRLSEDRVFQLDEKLVNFDRSGKIRAWLASVLRAPKIPPVVLLFSFAQFLLLYLINTAGSYLMIASFGVEIPIIDWSVINAMVSVVLFLPISYSGFGVREVTLIVFLENYNIANEISVAYSLLSFAVYALLVGLWWILLEFRYEKGIERHSAL